MKEECEPLLSSLVPSDAWLHRGEHHVGTKTVCSEPKLLDKPMQTKNDESVVLSLVYGSNGKGFRKFQEA